MRIRINKVFRKIAGAHVNCELVREVELAREKAWHDVYLTSGWIG